MALGRRMSASYFGIYVYVFVCYFALYGRETTDQPRAARMGHMFESWKGVVDGTERGARAWMKFGILDYGQSLHCILAALFCFYLT